MSFFILEGFILSIFMNDGYTICINIVFDCCFTTDAWEEENYKAYIKGVIGELRDHFHDASFLVFNFREGETPSQVANALSEYDLTIMDYPRHYEGCPLLTMEVIHHFLRSSESWLSLGQHNVLLMHCERGGWPVLAFMLAALLIYRKQYTGEQKTLDMIYKQAPRELLQLLSPLNPLPSQLRYLQYVARRNVALEWPPSDRALILDCIMMRSIPNFDGEGGCRPIYRMYGQDPSNAADRTPKVLYSTPKRSKTVRLYKQIDHRRAYNCEIMLSKVKVPLHDLVSSVLALEDSALDVDHVDNLIKFCPTKEEMELLNGYNGEKGKLGKCEQFFLELVQVPRVESKLRVFSFKIQFRSQVFDLRNSLNVVNSAAEEIRNSDKLKRIMQTVLSLGNALNQGTARGSAIGFRLDSLLKLTETRARNSKMTLMHYLCKVVADKLPELLDFSKDLTSLEPASKVQLKILAEEMQAISKGLEKVIHELSISENDGPISENFQKALKQFLSFAEAEVRSLASLYSVVGRHVDALILYFGEDPSRCQFEQVVSTLLNFVRMFGHAHEENCKQLELEKKKADKESGTDKSKIGGGSQQQT